MNERIKKLALDAGIGFTLWDDSGREMIDNYTPEECLEKFAELIVKECMEQVITGPKGPAHYAVEAALRLKKHFGVKE